MITALFALLIEWLKVVGPGPNVIELRVTDLGWRGGLCLIGILALPVLVLLTAVSSGPSQAATGVAALLAAATALSGIVAVLLKGRALTEVAGIVRPGSGRIEIAHADYAGPLPALAAVLLLTLLVIVVLTGPRRPLPITAFGVLLTVAAFAAPWRGAWLIDAGVVRYESYGPYTHPSAGSLGLLVGLLVLIVAGVAVGRVRRWLAPVVLAWAVGLFFVLLVVNRDLAETARDTRTRGGVDVGEVGAVITAVAIVALVWAALARQSWLLRARRT